MFSFCQSLGISLSCALWAISGTKQICETLMVSLQELCLVSRTWMKSKHLDSSVIYLAVQQKILPH